MIKQFSVEYTQQLDELRQKLLAAVDGLPAWLASEDSFANTCHIAEANLRHFYPDWGRARWREVIADVLQMQATAHAEQSAVPLMDCTALEDRSGVLAKGRPAGARIFCTYHIGSYRQFYLHLKKAGIDFLLLMSGKAMEQQVEWMLSDSKMVSEQQGWGGDVSIVNAESQSGLLQAVRALRRGLSVLIYIDGNSGVGGNHASENLRPVSFLGKELMARTGVATLSHMTKTPIVPVLCTRGKAGLQMTLHEAIEPGDIPREAYVRTTTQALYDLLAETVTLKPGQWEGWLYLHKFLRRQRSGALSSPASHLEQLPQLPVRADVDQFAMLYFASQAVLLNKSRHSFTILDSDSAATFRAIAKGDQPDWTAAPWRAALLRLFEIGALRAA